MNHTNEQYSQDNTEYISTSIMQLRLDSKEVLERLRFFLEGTRIVTDVDDEGQQIYKKIQVTEPKANSEGVNSLMSFLETKINPQVVQGFFPSDAKGNSQAYDNYLADVHESLLDIVITNCEDWDMRDEDLSLIIDTFMQMIEPFMSRLIGDGERKSYSQTMKVSENSTVKENGGFNLFSKRG